MAEKSLYTKRLGAAVASRARNGSSGRYHVISGEARKWSVVSEGSVRPFRAFDTKKEAVNFAKKTASKKTGEVIVHAKTGQIRDMISYAKR
jgi:hypothetical protein